MEISLARIYDAFRRADTDGDEKLSDQESARAAITAYNQGDSAITGFFGTLLKGGKDRLGLKPDLNNDGKVSYSEIATLAGKDRRRDSVSSEDFNRMFPGQTVSGGNNVDINELRDIANPSPFGGGDSSNLFKLLQTLLIVRLFLGGSGGGFGNIFGNLFNRNR
jgi:hypothetical protein